MSKNHPLEMLNPTDQRRVSAKTQKLEQTRLEPRSADEAAVTKSAWSLTKVKASSDEALK